MDFQPISGENKKNIYVFLLTKPQKGGGKAWHTHTYKPREKYTQTESGTPLKCNRGPRAKLKSALVNIP